MPPMAEQVQSGAVARDKVADSVVLPIGSAVNEQGHLEVGGCDVVAVAEELGTPAYIYAEDDLRARARAYREAFERRGVDGEVLFASKAFPATAAYKLFAEEGLSVDVASGGELHIALAAGFDPARIHMHGNNKSDEEILMGARAGIGHLILDSFDEIERCERLGGSVGAGVEAQNPGNTAARNSRQQIGHRVAGRAQDPVGDVDNGLAELFGQTRSQR